MDLRRPLRRSRRHRMVAGVCGGIAEWLGWDPTLVRVLYVVASIALGGVPRASSSTSSSGSSCPARRSNARERAGAVDSPRPRSATMAAVLRDAYGLTVSTDSRAAVDGYDRGVRALLGFGADTVTAFEAAVAADPEFALARAGLAVSRYLNEELPEGRAEMDRAVAAAKAPGLSAARAPPRRRPRALGGRARQRRHPAHPGDPRRASARHDAHPAPLLHPLLAGALRGDAGADGVGAGRARRRLLHAGASRLQPGGERPLRGGAAAGGARGGG